MVTESVNRGDIILMSGNFNAQVGRMNTGLDRAMGKHGLGRMTESEELFLHWRNTLPT